MPLNIKGNIISTDDITSVGVFKTEVNRDGLVTYLDAGNLDSYPTTGSVWTDLTGTGNFNLTGTTFSGGTINFNGTSDYAISASVIEFDRTNPFTLCGWARSTTVNNQQIISNENAAYRGYHLMIHSTNTLSFSHRTDASYLLNIKSVATLSANTWYYLCGTYNGNTTASGMSVYINGVKQSIAVGNDNLTGTTISGVSTSVGRRLPVTQGLFNGNIGIVQIYNRELNPYEIAENFQSTRGRYGI